jgi:diacylglycerol O-acyltransferase
MVDRLSPVDASFLHMEEDGVTQMHIGAISVFEGPPPPFADFLAMVAGKLPLVERYRQVVRSVPFDLGRPVWTDDQHFNLEYHVRHTALPSPGGDDELKRLVGRVMTQTLDRQKPLWETWVIEGLTEDRWAMLTKTHHAMIDGMAGTDLMSVMMDLSPEPTAPVPDNWEPRPAPSAAQLTVDAMVDLARSPAEQLRAARASVRRPREAARQLAEVAQGSRDLAGSAIPTAATSLVGPIGPNRRFSWATTSVDDIRAIRKGLGGTFNDILLAATAGGFRALLLSRGESVERPVRTVVPVSTRARDETGRSVGDGQMDNQVISLIAELPVGIEDPVERLAAVRAQMDGIKESKQAVAAEALMSLSGFAPPTLLAAGMRLGLRAPQRSMHTLTSNVPGPQFPLYALGRRMLVIIPYATISNQMRTAVTMFSYDGTVNFGLGADFDAVPDLDVLKEGIEASMKEMLAAC